MKKKTGWMKKRAIACLLTAVLAVGCLPFFAQGSLAEDTTSGGLQPAPNYYDNDGEQVYSSEEAALTLSKTAVRTAADTWRITVSATIDDTPIERQKMEVVFVLDASGSMEFCTDLAEHTKGADQKTHDHNSNCKIICGRTIHVHSASCYESTISCGMGEHTHGNSCYGNDYACGLTPHEHNRNTCYVECNRDDHPDHYNRNGSYYWHKDSGTDCTVFGNKYYSLTCTQQKHEHSNLCKTLICPQIAHTHSGACKELTCTKDEHEHISSCFSCGKVDGNHSPGGGNHCTYRVKENGNWRTKDYKTRLEVAKNTINGMINNLQADMGNDVSFRYVIFSSEKYNGTYFRNGVNKNGDTKEVSSFANVTAEGGTQLYHGIDHGLDLFSGNANTKKILVILNDGAADDKEEEVAGLSSRLTRFKQTNTIFTVGFAHDGDNLAQLAGGPGGQYLYASNEADLISAMADIQYAITAMLVDPMGPAVGFETGSIQIKSNQDYVDGDVDYENNTLYWNPSNDSGSIANKTIEYSYTVTLNEEGKLERGSFSGVPLNKPTELIYGIRDPETGTVSNTKKSQFPIPEASYTIASLTVKCQYNGQDIAPVLTDTAITDYGTPAFDLDVERPAERLIHKVNSEYYVFDEDGEIVYKINGSSKNANGEPYTANDMVPFPTDGENCDTNQYEVIFPYELINTDQAREVSYKFVGDVLPSDFNQLLPGSAWFEKGDQVTVAADPTSDGYVFNGWTEENGQITITDREFEMPDRDVVLVGSWSVKEKHNVTYSYDGDVPENVPALPPDARYYTLQEVIVATLPNVDGYIFTGWKMGNEILAGGSKFQMPDCEVNLVGTWEKRSYSVDAYYFTVEDGVTRQDVEAPVSLADVKTDQPSVTYDFTNDFTYGDTAYEEVQLYENSVGTIQDKQVSAAFGEEPSLAITLAFYRYVNNPYQAVVKYVDDQNRPLREDATSGAIPYGQDYDLTEAKVETITLENGDVYSFVSDDTVDNGTDYTGTMPKDGLTITRIYKLVPKYTVTVKYVSEDDNKATLTYDDYTTEPALEGTTYNVSDKVPETLTVDGKTWCYSGDDCLSGDKTGKLDGNKVITAQYYLKPTYSVEAIYTTITDGVSASVTKTTEAVTGEADYAIPFDRTVYDAMENGFTAEHFQNDLKVNGTGVTEMPKMAKFDTYKITLSYVREVNNSYEAVVKYVDDQNQTLREDATSGAIPYGQEYDLTGEMLETITLENGDVYSFVSDDTAENSPDYTGTMPKDGLTITRIYKLVPKYTVTVKYVSEDDNKATLTYDDYTTEPALEGTTYDVSDKVPETLTVDGKTWYYSGDDCLSGDKISDNLNSNKVITAQYYLKPTYSVEATYTTITDGVSASVTKTTEAVTGEAGHTIPFDRTVYDAMENGFTAEHFQNDLKVNGTGVTEMPKMAKFDTYKITLSYVREVNNSYEAVVKYVNDQNQTLREDATSGAIPYGQEYDLTGAMQETITLENGDVYSFVSDDTVDNGTAYTGKMPEGGVEITRTYRLVPKYTVTVKYVSEDDNKATLTYDDYTTEPALEGTTYNVSDKVPETLTVDGKTWYYSGDDCLSGDKISDNLNSNKVITAQYYLKPTYSVEVTYTTITDGVSASVTKTTEAVTGEAGHTIPFDRTVYDAMENGFTAEHFQNDLKVNGTGVTEMPEMAKFDTYKITLSYVREVNNSYEAVVKYVNDQNQTLREDATSGAIPYGQEYDLNWAKLETITLENGDVYSFVSDDTAENSPDYTGIMPKDGLTITRTYRLVPKYTVTVKYVSEDDNKATLTYDDYTTEPALEGTTYDVSDKVPKTLTVDGKTWYYSGDDCLFGDKISDNLNSNKVITAQYYLKPTYSVEATYTTITDGVSASVTKTTEAVTGEAGHTIPFDRTVYDAMENGFTAEHFQNDLKVNGTGVTEMPEMAKFDTYKITLSYERTIHTDVSYQVKHQYYEVALDGSKKPVDADGYTAAPVGGKHGERILASAMAADQNGKRGEVSYEEVSRTPESLILDKDSQEPQIFTITYERYQAPIVVHYEDMQGNPLKEDYTETLYAGDAYDLNTQDVQIVEIIRDHVPYDFVYDDMDADTGYSGILTKDGVEITLVYQQRGKATATVQYVDAEGNALQLPLMTEEMYIGAPYDVSEALQVEQIVLGGSEYAFDHHYQMRTPLRSTGSLTFVEDVDYKGSMPSGGIHITRVYRLDRVTYYYQQKNVFTAYDAEGNVLYSAEDELPVTASAEAMVTVTSPESNVHNGYGFWRVSEETQTADLTGSAPDQPYVFATYYEFHQGDDPVPDTELPPGITPPETPVDTLPPQTGDDGVALWFCLMLLAGAGIALQLTAQRKTGKEDR